ncbi:unnamed protein product, partial [Oppiella nova]
MGTKLWLILSVMSVMTSLSSQVVTFTTKEPFFKPFFTTKAPHDLFDTNKLFTTKGPNKEHKQDKQDKHHNNTYPGAGQLEVLNPNYNVPHNSYNSYNPNNTYAQRPRPVSRPYGGGGYGGQIGYGNGGQGHGNQRYGNKPYTDPGYEIYRSMYGYKGPAPRLNGPAFRAQTPYQPSGRNNTPSYISNSPSYTPNNPPRNGNRPTGPYGNVPNGNNYQGNGGHYNGPTHYGGDAPIYHGNQEIPIYGSNPQVPYGPNGPIYDGGNNYIEAHHYGNGNDHYSHPPIDYSKYIQPHPYGELSEYMSPEGYNQYANMLYSAHNLPYNAPPVPYQSNYSQPGGPGGPGGYNQQREFKMVVAVVVIQGMTPNYKYGIAIYNNGDVTNGCHSLGGHYNPGNHTHGNLNYPQSHAGDLGSVTSDIQGVAFVNKIVKQRFSIEDSNPIAGRSVGICKNPDDYGRGGTYASL